MTTPEQRAEWRKDSLHNGVPHDGNAARILALLDDLEAAEQWEHRYRKVIGERNRETERAKTAEAELIAMTSYRDGWVQECAGAEAEAQRLRAGIEALADKWERFDCMERPVPFEIDVPDDYEFAVNECGGELRALAGDGA